MRTITGKGRPGPDVLLLAAEIEILLGRSGPARSWIEEARVAGAPEADTETKEILLLAKSGARSEALAKLEALLAGNSESATVLYTLGVLELAAGQPGRGRRHLEGALRADPTHRFAGIRLAEHLLAIGKAEEAIEAVGPHVKRRPDDLAGLLSLAQALAADKRWGAAVETMRHAVSLHGNEPSVLNNFGVILLEGSYFKNEWLAEAIATHDRALKIAPDDILNAYNLCRCLTKRRTKEDTARTVEIYDDLLARTRGNPAFFTLRMRMHRNAGLIKSDTLKLWEEAYEHYKAFFEMGGKQDDEGVLDEWGKVLDGLGLPSRAPPEPDPEKHR